MKITVYGNNATCPEADGACACYLVETGEKRILLDMGNGSLTKLQKDLDIATLDCIVVSHLHFDHFGDLFCAKYQLETRCASGEHISPILLLAPSLPEWAAAELLSNDVFEYRVISDGMEAQMGAVQLRFFEMIHLVESYGLQITAEDRMMAYSGDTGRCRQLENLAFGADALLCEATFLAADSVEEGHHLSARSAGCCAAENGVGRLLLTHFHGKQGRDILEEAKKEFHLAQLTKIGETYEI